MQKAKEIFKKNLIVVSLLILWQILSSLEVIPAFFLPSPLNVIKAFIKDFALIMHHTRYTLVEAFIGISIAIILAFILSILLDYSETLYDMMYSPIILLQTIPSIVLAPLMIIWFGYDMTPKIILVIITVFFPILIALLDGYRSVDPDSIRLLKSMGASKVQMYIHVKLPASIGYFFAGLRVSMTYALISTVVAEWSGGSNGLGVYITRVRKAYAMDKMLAIVFFVSALSLALMALVDYINKKTLKY